VNGLDGLEQVAIHSSKTTNREKVMMKRLALTGLLMAGLGSGMAIATAQDARRGFDPEQMRERMMDRMKTELQTSDEEWAVIQPLLQNVMLKQREATAGRMGGMGAFAGQRGRPDGPGQAQAQGARAGRPGVAQPAGTEQVEALSKALESPNTSASELKQRLAAVRTARQKAEAELKQAREELRQVLTVRQEANLVLMGIMD
jgi:hypothetical protein